MDLGEQMKTTDPMVKDTDVAKISDALSGLRIAVGVGGGIAAIETPRTIRELRRLGAHVQVFATEQSLQFVGVTALEWASQEEVIVRPSGTAAHVSEHDALLICPATADLIGKAVHGICTDSLSTLVQSALGQGKPVVLCPSMHESMAHSPFVRENLLKLESLPGVSSIAPRREEGKWKSRPPTEVANEFSHRVHARRLAEREETARQHGLITLGGTRVPIDSVRAISNRSSGRLGFALATELYRYGIPSTLLICETQCLAPTFDQSRVLQTPTYADLMEAFEAAIVRQPTGLFHTAAVSDFIPQESDLTKKYAKISSDMQTLELSLKRSQKLIELTKVQEIPFKFVCKLTTDRSDEAFAKVLQLEQRSGAQLILWNTIEEAFGAGSSHHGQLLEWKNARLSGQREMTNKTQIASEVTQSFLQSL